MKTRAEWVSGVRGGHGEVEDGGAKHEKVLTSVG